MNDIKISIIIPVYNVEEYIHQCLDSVLSQSLREIEVICVDDESPDNCPQILDEYALKDSRVKVIHKENAGQGVARNTALEIATGKYIFFLDSDDWLEDGALEKMYNKMESDNSEILFINAYKYFEKDQSKKEYFYVKPYYNLVGDRVFSPEEVKEAIYFTNAFPLKMYRHESIKKYNFRYTEHRHWEDHLPYVYFLAKCNRMSILLDSVYNYRVRKNSSTNTSERCWKDCFDNFYVCLEQMENDEKTRNFLLQFLDYKVSNLFFHYTKMSLETKKDFYHNMQEVFRDIYKRYPDEAKKFNRVPLAFFMIKDLPYEVYVLRLRLKRTLILLKTYIEYFFLK